MVLCFFNVSISIPQNPIDRFLLKDDFHFSWKIHPARKLPPHFFSLPLFCYPSFCSTNNDWWLRIFWINIRNSFFPPFAESDFFWIKYFFFASNDYQAIRLMKKGSNYLRWGGNYFVNALINGKGKFSRKGNEKSRVRKS